MPAGGQYNLSFWMGKSYAEQERWKDALLWLRRAEDLDPNDMTKNAVVHFELARVYTALGDTAAAARERDMHQSIRSYLAERIALSGLFADDPNDVASGLKLARLCAAHGEESIAMGVYQRMLSGHPDLNDARRELNALLRKQGRVRQ
jgi:tetratricopeptide (TPR) repeat protein